MGRSKFSKFFPEYPTQIQIQTVNGCNASCITCPTGRSEQRKKRDLLPMELWEKIVEECSQWDHPLKNMVMSLFNEPFLDKRLLDMIDMAKERLVTTEFTVVTNGSFLTESNIERILQSQIDCMRISVNAYYKESFDLLGSRLNFDRIVEGTKQLLKKREAGKGPFVIVSMLETRFNTDEVQQFADFWTQLGATVHVSPAWNRAGNLPAENNFQLEPIEQAIQVCPKPFDTICITHNGDTVLCCGDYSAEVVLGNIKEQKLLEIWDGSKHLVTLIKMYKGENPLCNKCDKQFSFHTYENRTIPEPRHA